MWLIDFPEIRPKSCHFSILCSQAQTHQSKVFLNTFGTSNPHFNKAHNKKQGQLFKFRKFFKKEKEMETKSEPIIKKNRNQTHIELLGGPRSEPGHPIYRFDGSGLSDQSWRDREGTRRRRRTRTELRSQWLRRFEIREAMGPCPSSTTRPYDPPWPFTFVG